MGWFQNDTKPGKKENVGELDGADKLPSEILKKMITAEKAVLLVNSGDRVFIGSACATPRVLTKALEESPKDLADVQLFHFFTDGAIHYQDGIPNTRFQHRSFFVGTDTRELIKQGKADYIPISIAQVPALIKNGRFATDVAFIQVSLPEKNGIVSLGVSVDITQAVACSAKKVIAELNPNMPITLGNAFLHVDQIDHFVYVDTPVIEYSHPSVDDSVAKQIASYIARIIDDGSTLQIGLGRYPNQMLTYLADRRDLGIHSDIITDSIIDLVEKGVITGKSKSLHRGQIVTSFCMGTKRLYDMIHKNSLFAFYPIEYVCNPSIIVQNEKFVSISQAFAIDVTGQICADQFEGEFYSGVSTQPDFLRGAALSPGGKPIICLASTTDDGKYSRIRPLLLAGEGVAISRADVHYVITEYGIAYLFGKSIGERALALIEIAHPDFRPWLLEEAQKLGYVRPNQSLKSKGAYPANEERIFTLSTGKKLLIRPSKASDVEQVQDLFYNLRRQDVYTRFFRTLRSLSASQAEQFCNMNYESEMAFLAFTGERENEQIVGSCMYVLDQTTNLAEVAYMIHPEWQGMGIGKVLQERMVEYAKTKGFRGFTALILAENRKMIALMMHVSGNVSTKCSEGTHEIEALF